MEKPFELEPRRLYRRDRPLIDWVCGYLPTMRYHQRPCWSHLILKVGSQRTHQRLVVRLGLGSDPKDS